MKVLRSWATLQDRDRLQLRFFLTQSCLLLALTSWMLLPLTRTPFLLFTWLWVVTTFVFPTLAGVVPERWGRWVGRGLLAVVLLDFGMHTHQPLDPIMRMGLWLVWARTLTFRTTRESLQLLMIALMMIMFAGVISVEVSYAIQLLVFSPIAMCLLMLENTSGRLSSERGTMQIWKDFNLPSWMLRMMGLLSSRLVIAFAALWISLVLLSAVLFTVMPRFQFQYMLPQLGFGGSALSGFSENFDLNGIGEILESDQVAMRVDGMDDSWRHESLYWRMLTMDGYENGRFFQSRSPRPEQPVEVTTATLRSPRWMLPEYDSDRRSVWTAYLEGSVSRYLPVPGAFERMEFPHQQRVSMDPLLGTVALAEIPSKTSVFQWVGILPGVPLSSSPVDHRIFREHRADGKQHEASSEDAYPLSTLALTMSSEDRESLQSVLAKVSSGRDLSEAEEFALAATHYLATHHRYSLEPSSPDRSGRGRDPVVWWLEHQGRGHCEFFAAAFTLLAREQGHPCRIVTGFSGGDWSGGDQPYLLVRHRHAHAWCELWDDQIGWFRVDPTPGGTGVVQEHVAQVAWRAPGQSWRDWTESVRMAYYRRVIGFDAQTQRAMMEKSHGWLRSLFSGSGGFSWRSWFDKQKKVENEDSQGERETGIRPLVWMGSVLLITALFFRLKRLLVRKERKQNPVRLRAGRWLQDARLKDSSQREALLCLRFGPEDEWPDSDAVFRSCRSEVRAKRIN
jgi:protein-glutamine gamma-glutamyltransferase